MRRDFGMNKRGVSRFATALVVAALFSSGLAQQVQAATPKEQAIASYNAGKTAAALAQFKTLLKTSPNDAVAHYYLGLCYQKSNQAKLARSEYEWIASHSKDPGIVARANQGLQSLGVAVPASYTAGAAGGATPTVIDFSAEWCAPCKKFAPTFDRIGSNYRGRINFMHIDVDKPGSYKALVDKYNPSMMPTIVFQDARGNAKTIHEGVMEEAVLVQQTEALLK